MTRSLQFLSSTQYTEVAALPDSPTVGQTAFMNGILYIYASLNGVTTWFPLNQPQSFYIHSQGLAKLTWEIHHNLGSRDAIIAVYDMDNRMMDADIQHIQNTETGEWYIVATFTEAVMGYAVVFGRENISAPSVDAQVINATDGIYVGGVSVALETDVGLLLLELDKKVATLDIEDTVTSTDATVPLSANQGRVLKGLIDNINTLLASDDTTLDELQEVVNFIKQNKATLDSLGISSIAGLQDALDTLTNNLAIEVSRAQGAESTLQTNIDGKLDVTGVAADSSKLGNVPASEYLTVNDTIDMGEIA